MRLFVAIWPSAEAVAAIAADIDRARTAHPTLRWQPAERWHITLAFLGQADVDETQARIGAVLADPAGTPTPTPLRTSGAGTFGPVLWLGVEREAWLADLARRLQRTLRLTDLRFRAHVTVARGRGRDARREAAAAVPDLAEHRGPAWLPDEVTLVESVTGPAPRYTVIDRWPLGGRYEP